MHANCRILFLDLPYSVAELSELTVKLLKMNEHRVDTYVRPLSYKSTEGIGVRLHDLDDDFAIFTLAFGRYIESEEGARVCVSSWRRISDSAIPPRAKVTGAYINSALCKTEAALNGFDEAIVLTQDGHVSEGSAENLFIVRNGKLVTSPVSEDILEGITRATIMELASAEMGLEVVERKIDRTELYVAEEAFFCGTGVQVAAIVEVDHRKLGTGKIGPVVSNLRNLYFDVVRGKVKKYRQWCTPVY
jgi:branched-chain amino acid aminotransferase